MHEKCKRELGLSNDDFENVVELFTMLRDQREVIKYRKQKSKETPKEFECHSPVCDKLKE